MDSVAGVYRDCPVCERRCRLHMVDRVAVCTGCGAFWPRYVHLPGDTAEPPS